MYFYNAASILLEFSS